MTSGARQQYARILEVCTWAGAADQGLLEVAAVQYDLWRSALAALAETGPTYRAASGLEKQHPLFQVAQQSMSLYLKCCCELGLTPSSRTRVEVTEPELSDPLEDWQKGN